MSRAVLFWLSVIVCCAGWVSLARADGGQKTVVMLVVPSVQPLARRLRQEIEALGLVVKWMAPEGVRLPSLEDEAIAADAVASIRIAPAGSGDVDMTIFDGGTGKTTNWKVVGATTSDPAAAEIIATRAIELLRASLLEMAARRAVVVEPSPPAPEIQPLARSAHDVPRMQDPPASLSLLAGPSLLYSPNWQPGVHALTSLTWMPIYRAGLSASVLVPISPARLTSQEGSVDLFATFYRLGAVLELTRSRSAVSLRLTAAASLGRLHLSGNAYAPNVGDVDDRFVASPSAGLTTRLFVAPNLSFFADVMGSAAFPKTIVRLAGRAVTGWGQPALAGAIGLELSWQASEGQRAEVMSAAAAGRR
jgi:hypothetical protein